MKIRRILSISVFGLATALSFSISPVFLRYGLDYGGTPEMAVTIGIIAAFGTYLVAVLLFDPAALKKNHLRRVRELRWEAAAAVTIVVGTWLRYVAIETVPLAVVSAIGRINILVILLLDRRNVGVRAWIGGALIVAGTAVLSL